MKKIIRIFIALLFISILSYAQGKDYKLNMRMIIELPDTQSVILNYSGSPDEAIEGYYLQSRYKDFFMPNAALQKGGFNFLNDNIFGGMVRLLSKKWVKNNFPITDVAPMTNGLAPAKVLSFQIKPMVIDGDSDTLNLLVKYALIDYWGNKESSLDFTSHVHVYYKWLRVKYNKNTEFKIFDEIFRGSNFTARFWKGQKKSYAVKNNDRLFGAIKESSEESELDNVDFSFNIRFIRTDALDGNRFKYLARYQEINLPAADTIINNEGDGQVQLPAKIYYGRLRFPFTLYNTEKAKRYAPYKTKNQIFQSTYDVVIVPIKITEDSLTYDLFLNYVKLNLGDGIPRWTPIKKRITVSRDFAVGEIVFPKENWSANFTREGENYDIYGYSDFEQYVSESLRIKFKVLKRSME